jgi:transposase
MTLNRPRLAAASPTPIPLTTSVCPPPPAGTCPCGCFTRRPRYGKDLTDTQWAIIEPLLPAPAGRGRPEKHHRRAIVDAIFFWVNNGVKWRDLPADYPPWRTVYGFLSRWSDRLHTLHLLDRLRELVRIAEGRNPTPTAGIIDSQSVAESAEATVNPATSGYDGNKNINGRKRHLLVDTSGNVVYALVSAANILDFRAAAHLLAVAAAAGITHVWADHGYNSTALINWADHTLGLTLEIVERPHPGTGFQIVHRRWVVERTNAHISHHRRCARDYERTITGHLNAVWWSAILGMTGKLTGTTARWKTRGRLPQPEAAL